METGGRVALSSFYEGRTLAPHASAGVETMLDEPSAASREAES